jgi:hypothetical protein
VLASDSMIRIMRVLLASEKEMSLRELALKAQVTLSRASREMGQLHKAGITRKGTPIKILKRQDLQMAFSYSWSIMSIPFKAFDALERSEQLMTVVGEIAKKGKLTYGLTLLAGAELLSPYVVPTSVHLYIDPEQIEKWSKGFVAHGIYPSEGHTHSKINLLLWDKTVLYGAQEHKGLMVVHPCQLFADLHGMSGIYRDAAYELAKRLDWKVR